jgi:hypothetical protein
MAVDCRKNAFACSERNHASRTITEPFVRIFRFTCGFTDDLAVFPVNVMYITI